MGLFSKFVIRGEKSEFLHSSGYGVAQNGNNMGASSTRSFAEREAMERNRQRIKGYNDSRIAAQTRNFGAQARTFSAKTEGAGVKRFEGGGSASRVANGASRAGSAGRTVRGTSGIKK